MSVGAAAALGALPIGVGLRGIESAAKYSDQWSEGNLDKAIDKWIGFDQANIYMERGKIFFETPIGETGTQAIVVDPDGVYFTMERVIAAGLVPEYYDFQNEEWLFGTPGPPARAGTHVNINGAYPTNEEAAIDWYEDLKAQQVADFRSGERDPDSVEAWNSENNPDWLGYGVGEDGVTDETPDIPDVF